MNKDMEMMNYMKNAITAHQEAMSEVIEAWSLNKVDTEDMKEEVYQRSQEILFFKKYLYIYFI